MTIMGGPQAGTTAVGETVASFTEYEAAQKAVSQLVAAEVRARDIAIVGLGLRSIERVTGKLGYATAARSGAINGILIGLFFSAILVLGTPTVPIQAFVGAVFVGIAVGMILSLITYSIIRRKRDFASSMQVVADHYDVTVAAASIHRAREVLSGAVVSPRARASAEGAPVQIDPVPESPIPDARSAGPDLTTPPRYGERVTPPAAPETPQQS